MMTKIAYCMWDQDGVSFPFTRIANKYFGWPDREWTVWSEFEKHGWTAEQFLGRLRAFESDGGFRYGDPYPDFVEAHTRLQEMGVVPIVVTDKPTDRGVQDNLEWLREIGCEPHKIIRSRVKADVLDHTIDKSLPVFGIDDNVGHVEAMRSAGITAFLRDRPWNRHGDHLPRVFSLHQFADIVEILLIP